jgi:hypothetical protein
MDPLWYKNAIIYTLDIKSFSDSNGDGVGDLAGAHDRLGYLAELGVVCGSCLFIPRPGATTATTSPTTTAFDTRLGTHEEFERLVHAAGEHGIRNRPRHAPHLERASVVQGRAPGGSAITMCGRRHHQIRPRPQSPITGRRVGPAKARVAAMLLLSLRGTPPLYYGDELGMRNVPVPPERVQDPLEKNMPGLGFGRDPQRAPMPWETGRTSASPRPRRGCRCWTTTRTSMSPCSRTSPTACSTCIDD